jgi:hypothetical protein
MKKDVETSPAADDTPRTERMRVYRQRYWERFRETRRRVYGTLTAEEYASLEQRATEAGRAVWSQIHAEAEAYARGEYLPPKDIEERIGELIVQLRRIGNNVNQLVRESYREGELDHRDFIAQLQELESLIRVFVKRPWGDPPEADDEPPEP